MSWDDYGYGYNQNVNVNDYFLDGNGYTDMYGNKGGALYGDSALYPAQPSPNFSGGYGSTTLPHSNQMPKQRRSTSSIQSIEESGVMPPTKKVKSIKNRTAEFQDYLEGLPEDHRQAAKILADQLKSFKSGRLSLPDERLVPLPEYLLPTAESSLATGYIELEAGSMKTAFIDDSQTLKTNIVILPPWPEASALKEINQHQCKDQVPVDIIESMKNDNNISPLCFGHLVGEELKKIEAHKRVDIAKRIMAVLTKSEEHVGPPELKRRRLEDSVDEEIH